MDKKKILNRTLPLIIALVVILVVAVSVTIFSGAKKTPTIDAPDSEYLTADLGDSKFGYSQNITVTSQDVYDRLKNGDNGLQFLVDMLDKKLLTEAGYVSKVTEEEIKDAVEEAIFGKDFEFDSDDFDDNMKKIEDYIKKMDITYGIKIKKESITIDGSALDVKLADEQALKDYYTIVIARKLYTRAEMGKDQEESYKEFIEKYEDYLEELHKFNEEEISKAPTAPVDGSTITSANVQSDYEKENADSYWTLFVTYETKEEAEKALLQVGVVIYNSTWYEYAGDINLNNFKDPETHKNLYSSLSAYYKAEGHKLGHYEITTKLVELYNNSKVNDADAKLEKGVHYNTYSYSKADYDTNEIVNVNDRNKYQEYTIKNSEYEALDENAKKEYSVNEIDKEAYDKLDDDEKELYTQVGEKYQAYQNYKAIIFATELKKNAEGEVDKEAKENALYFTAEDLTKIDGSIHSYIKSLTAAYAEDATWNKSYTKSIQAKGSYYILGAKFLTIEVKEFDEVYGTIYDKEKFEEDGTIESLGFVDFTVDEDGNKKFDFENSAYWKYVNELLDDAVSAEKINEYMGKLRNEKGLIIYDEKIESAYMSAYKSDYKATKKSNASIVAKLAYKNEAGEKVTFEVTAQDLYNELNRVFGAITATDAFQYENILFQNEIIDYGKYKDGASLKNCVIVTEYALANKGSKDPITAWKKVNTDGEVIFDKVNDGEYDILVRKGTSKKDRIVEVATDLEYKVEDNKATVTVSDEPDYLDAEGKYNGLDDQIAALKLYFTNGNFAEYGYDASYGWKNFLRDYFEQFYGIKVKTNEDLKLYYIYEDAVKAMTDDLADQTKDNWDTVYLPFMQQQYDKFFSVDAAHFLIYIENEDGEMVDPAAEDTTWTTAQSEAAKSLYAKVYEILKKTKKADQAKVLQDIVDAIAAAPRFVDGVALNTAAQKEYIENNPLYEEKKEDGTVTGYAIEYTTTIKGVELETSLYKTLGIKAKYEDLGTVTADKMVKNFEDALKLMWNTQNNNGDNGMKEGTALETNDLYIDYASAGEYLTTEFGYHVLIANKFTGRPTEKDEKVSKPVTLPSLDNVLIYEKDNKEVDDLTDFEIAQIKNYYDPIRKEFESSHWYQLNVMKNIIATINAGTIKFADESNKEKAIAISEYYIEQYYKNLNFIGEGYKHTLDLMKIGTEAMKGLANNNDNITAENMDKIIVTIDNAIKAMTSDGNLPADKYNATEIKDFKEAYDAYMAAKAARAA